MGLVGNLPSCPVDDGTSLDLFSFHKLLPVVLVSVDDFPLEGLKLLLECDKFLTKVILCLHLLRQLLVKQNGLGLIVDLLSLVESFLEVDSILLVLQSSILIDVND